MGEFEVVALGKLGADRPSAFATGPFGSAVSAKNFVREGVPMLRGGNLSEDVGLRLDESELVFVPEELARKYSRSVVERGDLVFTCWGTVGQIGILDGSNRFDRYLVSNKQMKLTVDDRRVLPLYLYYFLSQRSMINLVQGQAIGSSVPGFNLGQLKALPVRLPSLRAQRTITGLLGALDDKIAANEQTLQLMDQMFHARWQQLYIGGSCKKELVLGDVVTTQYGLTASASSDPDGLKFLRVTDINKTNWLTWSSIPTVPKSDNGGEKYTLRKGDLLVARMADPGKSAIYDDERVPAVFASYLVRLQPRSYTEALYLYGYLKSKHYRDYAEGATTGSVQKNMNARVIIDTRLRWPTESAMTRFADVGSALREAINEKVRESGALARTRDELLPLLMSGKLRVKDAEAVASAVL